MIKKMSRILVLTVSIGLLTGCHFREMFQRDYGDLVFNLSGTTVHHPDQPWINLRVQNRTDVAWVIVSDLWMEYQDGDEWIKVPNDLEWDRNWDWDALSNDSDSDRHGTWMVLSLYELLHPDYPVEGMFQVRVVLSDEDGEEVMVLTSGERELTHFSFE
ncbi:MAG: hypothetical protein FWG67_06070 [Defluviitaleaceae bacterium]|nr:hypothetical protein [Defluviitaleaceae bacterium]